MNVYSVKNDPELCKSVKLYCLENWNKVYRSFAENADKSVNADILPQTWVITENEEKKTVFGFYQLVGNDSLTRFADRSPFIASLYVDEKLRNSGCGEMLLNHAKYEAAKLGFEKVYLSTDHIGYYEKYGFHEIGVDIYTWGRAAKVYEACTPSDVRLEIYDRNRPVPDHIFLEYAKFRRGEPGENPSRLLWNLKYLAPVASNPAKWFSVAAFAENKLAGWVNFMREPENSLKWYLGDLAVISEFRRRGTARRMINTGLDIIRSGASGGESVFAYIEKNNVPSLCLHKTFGFIDTGELLPFGNLDFSDNETTHILFLDDRLTVKAGKVDHKAVSRLYSGNIEALHGGKISEDEWKDFLSLNDKDEEHFLIFKGAIPVAWLKVNGLKDKETGWVSMLAVDTRFQRMGMGEFAVNSAEDFLRLMGKVRVRICTTADNEAAQRLYKKCGYSVIGNREIETGDGVKREGLVFEKIIL